MTLLPRSKFSLQECWKSLAPVEVLVRVNEEQFEEQLVSMKELYSLSSEDTDVWYNLWGSFGLWAELSDNMSYPIRSRLALLLDLDLLM